MSSRKADQFTLASGDTVHGYVVLGCSYKHAIKWNTIFAPTWLILQAQSQINSALTDVNA